MITSLDRFIERTAQLLEARPNSTKVTTTYTHKRAKHTAEHVTSAGSKPASVTVKTYDPVSGAIYRIRLHKINEISRVLSALGPRSIALASSSKGSKTVPGAASIMAKIDPIEESEVEPIQPTQIKPSQPSQAGKKKKGKK